MTEFICEWCGPIGEFSAWAQHLNVCPPRLEQKIERERCRVEMPKAILHAFKQRDHFDMCDVWTLAGQCGFAETYLDSAVRYAVGDMLMNGQIKHCRDGYRVVVTVMATQRRLF